MLNKLLRKLENSGWTTAALGDGWDDEEEAQPAPVATAPTPSPAAAPVAPAPPVKQPVPQGQMQQVSRPQQPVQTPYVAPASEDGPDIVAIQKWVRQNYDTPAPLPSEWASGGKALLTQLGKSVHVISREMKREPQNPTLAQVKKLVPEGEVEQYDPNAKINEKEAPPMTPEQEKIRRQRIGVANEFYNPFVQRFPDFIKEVQSRARGSAKKQGKQGDDAGQDFLFQEFYPPDNINIPDKRLEILGVPAIRQELMQYQPFGTRFTQWLSQNGIAENDLDGLTANPKRDRKNPILPKLAELFDRQPANQPNSIPDAMNAITQQGIPPALKGFWDKMAHKFGKGEEAASSGPSLDAPAGENKTIGDFQSGSGDGIGGTKRDLITFDTEEQDAYFDMIKQKIMPKMHEVVRFNKMMSNKVYDHFADQYEQKNRVPTVAIGGRKGDGRVYNAADVFTIFSEASLRSFGELFNPKNRNGRINFIKKNITGEGEDEEEYTSVADKATGQFSNQNFGRLTLNMGGENLSEMGINARGLVNNRAVIPYFYQLGLLKEAIYKLYEGTTQDLNLIAQKVKEHWDNNLQPWLEQQHKANPQAFAVDPNVKLGIDITPAFVQQSILLASRNTKNNRDVEGYDSQLAKKAVDDLKVFMDPNIGKGLASDMLSRIGEQWIKVVTPLAKSAEEFGPEGAETFQLWGDLIGMHRRMVEPVNEADVNRVQSIPQEAWGGASTWKEQTQEKIMNQLFPEFGKLDPGTRQVYEQRTEAMRKNRKAKVKAMQDSGVDKQQIIQMMPQITNDAIAETANKVKGAESMTPEEVKKFDEMMTFDKRWAGMTSSSNMRKFWQHLRPGQPLPPHMNEYLQWREKNKSERAPIFGNAYLLRRLLAAYDIHADRLTKLASIKASLSKVGQTPRLDNLISGVRHLALADLHSILDLLE